MDIVRGNANLERPAPVVAIGNFDGVHRGHQAIFAMVRDEASRRAGTSVVYTFDPHPSKILNPALAPPLIMPRAETLRLLGVHGIDVCAVETFDRDFAKTAPEDFVKRRLLDWLGAAHVFVGYDFSFGRDRAGSLRTLRDLGARFGFAVTTVDAVVVNGIVASSTKVREFVHEGRVEGAAMLLGRPFQLIGEVVRGDARGRTLGFPTANLAAENELHPKEGVYAGRAAIGDDLEPRLLAVVNIGRRPTFIDGTLDANGRPAAPIVPPTLIEAHLLDFAADLYGKRIRLDLVARLRDERRFPGVDALKQQIAIDVTEARKRLS